MAVLPPDATFEEFCEETLSLRGMLTSDELVERWEFRNKIRSVKVHNGEVANALRPSDERGLTKRERSDKIVAEAKSQGRNIEPAKTMELGHGS